MNKLFAKFLKQSLIILGIVIVFIICSSTFGSIHMISYGIDGLTNGAKELSNNTINTDGEISDVEGYGMILNGIVSGLSYLTAGLLWILKILMIIIPIILFLMVAFSNLIAWLFNLGKEARWKRNTGIVFWSINLAKLVAIVIMAVSLVIDVRFPIMYYGEIIMISVGSIVWQVVLMVKNKECLKIVKNEMNKLEK